MKKFFDFVLFIVSIFAVIFINGKAVANPNRPESVINYSVNSESQVEGKAQDLGIFFSVSLTDNDHELIDMVINEKKVAVKINNVAQEVYLKGSYVGRDQVVSFTEEEISNLKNFTILIKAEKFHSNRLKDSFLNILTLLSDWPTSLPLEYKTKKQPSKKSLKDKMTPWVSICKDINTNKIAKYPNIVPPVDWISKKVLVGPYPWGSKDNGCMGRCGGGCGWDIPFEQPNDLKRFTKDCLNHDMCSDNLGRLDPRCVYIFKSAIDDYLFAPICDCKKSSNENSYSCNETSKGTLIVSTQDANGKQIEAAILLESGNSYTEVGKGKVTLALDKGHYRIAFGELKGYQLAYPNIGNKTTGATVKIGKTTKIAGIYKKVGGTTGELNWTVHTIPYSCIICADMNGVAYGNGTFVAVGEGIWVSSDGATWVNKISGESLNVVAYGNGIFVALSYQNDIWTSTDGGVSWISKESEISGTIAEVAYGNGTFVAVGDGGIWVSSDNGATWTSKTLKFERNSISSLNGVAYGNGTFLVVPIIFPTKGNFVFSSSDGGASWVIKTLERSVDKVAYGNGVLVAMSSDIIGASSDDGATWAWKKSPISFPIFKSVNAITYGNGTFVAVTLNKILTSSK